MIVKKCDMIERACRDVVCKKCDMHGASMSQDDRLTSATCQSEHVADDGLRVRHARASMSQTIVYKCDMSLSNDIEAVWRDANLPMMPLG